MEETKADILLSYGYNKEAVKFYTKVLKAQPNNVYAKYNIFVNLTLNPTENKLNKDFFLDNLDLIKYFPNNRNILIKYYDLAKLLKKNDCVLLFETLLFHNNYTNKIVDQLNKQTKDYNLKKIIKLYN